MSLDDLVSEERNIRQLLNDRVLVARVAYVLKSHIEVPFILCRFIVLVRLLSSGILDDLRFAFLLWFLLHNRLELLLRLGFGLLDSLMRASDLLSPFLNLFARDVFLDLLLDHLFPTAIAFLDLFTLFQELWFFWLFGRGLFGFR